MGRPRDQALRKPKFETTNGGGSSASIPKRPGKDKDTIRGKSKYQDYPGFNSGGTKPKEFTGS